MFLSTNEILEVGDKVSFPMPEDLGKEDEGLFDHCYKVKVLAASIVRVDEAVVEKIIR